MLINLRNALMTGKRLPYDAEVEYLESTGTQWIDTEVYGNLDSVAEITAQWTGTSGFAPLFGARNSYNSRGFAVYNGSDQGYLWCFSFDNVFSYDWARSNVLSNDGLTHNIRIGYNCRVDNWSATWSAAGQFTTSNTLLVFAWNQNGTITAGSYRVYSCKIWDNGALVRDLIPVRKGTVGYLYDRVSGKLFGNAGTGDFVLGQDVVPVEYIESHGTEYINTGIILNDTYGIDISFAPMETASGVSEHGIFGSSVSGSGIRHNVLQIHSSAGGVGLWMPSNTRICNYAITIGEYQHWQINLNDSDEVIIDNVLKAHTHPTTPAECRYPVYLFGRNVANTLKSGSCSKMRLATWMVCDGSGNFIQKWLPVRVGTEGAMMDVLTRRIYRNQGTGAFAYGNDLKYPIPAS